METIKADAINRRAAEVAGWLHSVIDIPGWLHSVIDIPGSPFGTPPHEESTHKIHFGIPDAFAKSICEEDYHKYYEPRVVSIGPFHHGKPHVAPMENFKRQAVTELAERVKSEVSIEQVYASLEQDLLRIAKECYDVSHWHGISDREWCLMMFLDGCFVIEFISNYHDIKPSVRWCWLSIMKKHDRHLVLRDLLLLENQLPFQVLEMLAQAFRCETLNLNFLTYRFLHMPLLMISSAPSAPLFIYAASLRCPHLQQNAPAPVHLLQYYRDMWVSVLFKDDVEEEKEKEEDHLAVCPPFSVTELKKVGIRCSCAMDHRDFFSPKNIHFKSSILSGHLFLPQLTIHEWTVTMFSNILAYGDSCSMLRKSSWLSSYLNFMCMLINGEEDVKELRTRGILKVNFKIGDDQLINFLRDITAHNESNHKVIRYVKEQISAYFKSKRLPLRICYAEIKQRYFSGPWSFLVFLAVIFTVSMTVIQTVLTGIQTYK